jgi:hypothetical protein
LRSERNVRVAPGQRLRHVRRATIMEKTMGSGLEPGNLGIARRSVHQREEITVFAALAGPPDASPGEIRRLLMPGLPARTWHRVFPFLPRECGPDGAGVVWHPLGEGWRLAVDCVHARRPIPWRLSGAYLQWPGSDLASPTDLVDFDEIAIADWSLAVPDADYRAFCRRGSTALRLSELVARWVLAVGPSRAGRALLGCHPRRNPGSLEFD